MTGGSKALRRQLVDHLEKSRAIKTDPVRRAFLSVPRELFVPEIAEKEGLEAIYKNVALPTRKDSRGIAISSSSEPTIMARMLERLELSPGLRVLEIGTGTGYNAALLKQIVGSNGEIVTVDLEPELATRAKRVLRKAGYPIKVFAGDGRTGWQAEAPYDRIIVTASSKGIPQAWYRQLREGGLLVVPLSLTESGSWPQAVVTLKKEGSLLTSTSVLQGGFMSIRRKPGDPSPDLADVVYAGAKVRGKNISYGTLQGPALARISNEAKKRLVSLLGSEPRLRNLERRPHRYDFEVFLGLVTDPDSLVWFSRSKASNLAVVAKDGASLALLSGGKRFFSRMESYGDSKAKNVLMKAVNEWIKVGKPRLRDLRIDVTFDHVVDDSWRSWREGRSFLSFNWGRRL